jgi:hypothetical protein
MFGWLSHLELKACGALVRHVLHVDVRGGVVNSCVCYIEGNSPSLLLSVAESEETCRNNEHMLLLTYVLNQHLQNIPLPLFC